MKYPKICLAIDNCFAYKRWTEPEDWARVISEMGVTYVEGSADTELDPLFMGQEYLTDWVRKVKMAEKKYSIKVANLYSGHGTYSALGLTHTDGRVRERMQKQWFQPMIDVAAQLNAGVGFYAHGFSEAVLQDEREYARYCQVLLEELSNLNQYAAAKGCAPLAVEQMYVPFLVPWTMRGTLEVLKEVKKRSGSDFYFTEDLGHHHIKFIRPAGEQIREAFERRERNIWLGSNDAFAVYDRAVEKGELSDEELQEIEQLMDQNSRFFAGKEDGDCYAWLSSMGRYSPIIHLQQTDGTCSAHKPFTEEENAKGKIKGEKVLRALKESYDREKEEGMPEPCDTIYLTLEIFSGTTQTAREILMNCRESVKYWRRFIPKDNLTLDELVKGLEEENKRKQEKFA